MKTVKTSNLHDKAPKTKTQKVKHKRQTPVPGIRQSVCNIATTQINNQIDIEEPSSVNVSLAVAAMAAAAIATSSSKKRKSISPIAAERSRPSKSTRQELNSWHIGMTRLKDLGFKLSESQAITPSDGNYFYHCINDQCGGQSKDHSEV